jgi:hypothetical protein
VKLRPIVTSNADTVTVSAAGETLIFDHVVANALAADLLAATKHEAQVAQNDRLGREHEAQIRRARGIA